MDWILRSAWAYPALETVHLVGIGLLLGSLVVFELRVWGYGASLDAPALQRLALPVTIAGFGLAVFSGVVLFAAQPGEMLANPAFVWKMGLLVLAGANAGFFHARGGLARADRWSRALTAISLGLWCGVIACGRFIAYK